MKNDMNVLEQTIKSQKEQLKVATNDNVRLRYGASFLFIVAEIGDYSRLVWTRLSNLSHAIC